MHRKRISAVKGFYNLDREIKPFSNIDNPSLENMAHNSTVGAKDKARALLWAEPTFGSKWLGIRLLTIRIDQALSRYSAVSVSLEKMIAPSWMLGFERTASSRIEIKSSENVTPISGMGSLAIGKQS